MLQEKIDEKHTRTTDSVDYIRSDHLIDESFLSTDTVNQAVISEDVKSSKSKKVICFLVLTLPIKSRTKQILIIEKYQHLQKRVNSPTQGAVYL